MADPLETALVDDLGLPFFATMGGTTGKLAAMKAKLGKTSHRKRFALFDGLDAARVRAALDAGKGVAARCARAAAVEAWPPLARTCAAKVGRRDLGASAHVALGSLVAMSGAGCWCVGGFADQRDCQQAGAALVAESKRRSEAGVRTIYVVRPEPVCGADELKARADHLWASVPGNEHMRLDEEAAYSVSNEASAAKVAAVARRLGDYALVVDATACVGGNAIAFARAFPRVVAVEIDASKAAKLAHNVAHVRSTAPLGAVDVVVGDCLDELDRVPELDDAGAAALVFADPPWGGRHYKFANEADEVHLKGGGGGLEALVGLCARKRAVGHLLLKVPFNFNAASLAASRHVRRLDTVLLSSKVTLLVLHLEKGAPGPKAKRKRERGPSGGREHKGKKKKKKKKKTRDD